MTIYTRPSKGFPFRQASSRRELVVRSWVPPAVSPPLVRTPAFMLGGRFAVIREPHFMLDARPGAVAQPESRSAGKPALSIVDPSDKSPNGK
jgi:hypothetical protein